MSAEVLLDDPNFKYVIVPCVESIENNETGRFAIVLLAPDNSSLRISQLAKYESAEAHVRLYKCIPKG